MKLAYLGVLAGIVLASIGAALWSLGLGLVVGGLALVWFFVWVYDVDEGGEL